ncbi:malonyl-[acyl-carrier protein] O-methyltransferase [Geobacter sp. OR-1]|uniref:methyltransferase domain-containing protein n=1 Tax=Geobacter sp. OR-1 TaxID=1266765 RepID=UPI0005427C93|nr:methyltransferase domain-containing protein [Geobacter sp. OR-1]GAM08061.1 malonyl-[acyl-carrier protein] O-methyltransferase [Geobacter sp. OR-1]
MPGIDRLKVRRSFDAQAHEYDRHAVVQKRVIDRIVRLLPPDISPGLILDIGSGTGALLQRMAARYAESRLMGLDMAFGMGVAARDRLAGNSRVQFVTADAEHLPFSDGSFDLVLSTSTFQWLERLEPAFMELRRVLQPEGRFCFALFGEQTLFELRDSYRAALAKEGKGSPDRTHRFKSSDNVATALAVAGLELEYLVSELEVDHYPDVPHLLRSIRRIGAGNAAPGSSRGLSERRVMLGMMAEYQRVFGGDGRIPATYEVIYGVVRKKSAATGRSAG